MASPTEDITSLESEPSVEETGEWQELNPPEYLKQVTDLQFINISIKGYEKKTTTSFPKEEYYAYRIVSILTDASVEIPKGLASLTSQDEGKRVRQEVWRRYSEFEVLRNFLFTICPHVVIPPLPEKTYRGSSGLLTKITFTGEDADFLVKRQQALEIFLVRISRHPVLSKNYWFHQFMHNIGWKESLQKTGYSAKAETLFQSLSLTLSKQSKPDSRFQEVKTYADELELVFKALLDVRERMNNSMKTIYKIHSNYGRVFSEWSETEDTLGTPLQIAGGCMDSYSESIETYLDEEETRFMLPLKEYISYCDALRAVVRRQELLQKELEKSQQVLAAKMEVKEALVKEKADGVEASRFSFRSMATRLRGGDTSYEGRLTVATRELQEAEDAEKQAQKELDSFTKKALEELERFSSQKNSDFRSILINYGQLQLHIHRKGITTWERVKQGFAAETL